MKINDLFTEDIATDPNPPFLGSVDKTVRKIMKDNGYKRIGRGADSTVWTKDAASVVKVLMPDSDDTDVEHSAKVFKKFYEFSITHQDVSFLPKWSNIDGAHYKTIKINGKDYILAAMERLTPIRSGTMQEAMVWGLSDLSMTDKKWNQVKEEFSNPAYWAGSFSNKLISKIITELETNPEFNSYYELLYTIMQGLYKTGKINNFGWDLHTENVMQRKDGSLVIIDPWFAREYD